MKCNATTWVVYDTRNDCIAESGDNWLPLIFEDEDAARDCADLDEFWIACPVCIKLLDK